MDNKMNQPTGTKNFNTSTSSQTGGTPSQENDSITHKVGDAIEHLGQKIANAGATTIGKAIENAGDKIEHLQDKKNDRH